MGKTITINKSEEIELSERDQEIYNKGYELGRVHGIIYMLIAAVVLCVVLSLS